MNVAGTSNTSILKAGKVNDDKLPKKEKEPDMGKASGMLYHHLKFALLHLDPYFVAVPSYFRSLKLYL